MLESSIEKEHGGSKSKQRRSCFRVVRCALAMPLDCCGAAHQSVFDFKLLHATGCARSSVRSYFSVAGSGQVGMLSLVIIN